MSWPLRSAAAVWAALALAPPGVEGATGLPTRPPAEVPLGADAALGVLTLRAPGSRMILVRASKFWMGSTDDDVMSALVDCQREPGAQRCDPSLFADEIPRHEVTLSAYWLDRTEVTVADYARCAALGHCRPLLLDGGAQRFARPSYPASMVTWFEARDFCEFRGARLPTEAEFERAARGVSRRRYPWGNVYDSHVANHGRLAWTTTDPADGFAELAPVGSFPDGRTPEGFLDLAGNVSEWVQDRYAPSYPEGDSVDPTGPAPEAAGPARVVRGGSYENAPPWLRGAARHGAEPATRSPSIGFRCARSAAGASAEEGG